MFGRQSIESGNMGLAGHLDELRRRILICLVFFAGACVVLFSYGYELLAFIEMPARGVIREFIFTGPTEALTAYCKVVFLAAFAVTFPVVLYELWAFVAPAMPQASRRFVLAWFFFALFSFLGGISFAYAILLPYVFSFLVAFGQGIATPMISVSSYVSFAVAIVLMGGVIFEIPCVMAILTEAGILSTRFLCSSRGYAILIIFISAAIITPTQDALNMILFALPMVFLFEVGVLVCGMIEKRKINLKKEQG